MSTSPTEDPHSVYERTLAELASRLLNGQADVLRDVLLLLGGRTERAIRNRLGTALSDADYEDVMSIALFRLWQRRDRFDPSRSRLDRWFYVLARNIAVDSLRRGMNRREDAVDDLDRLPALEREDGGGGESGVRRDLSLALDRMSPMDRRILLSGLTDAELSHELGLRPGAIRVRRLRSKERLRVQLRDLGHFTQG